MCFGPILFYSRCPRNGRSISTLNLTGGLSNSCSEGDDLTAEQRAALAEIMETNAEFMAELRASRGPDQMVVIVNRYIAAWVTSARNHGVIG